VSESSPAEGAPEEPFNAEEFARTINRTMHMGDYYTDILENRVIRLEEIIAARWPRSLFLRWRLARELRASVATWDPEYIPRGDFRGRRLEAVTQQAMDMWDRERGVLPPLGERPAKEKEEEA
jgi:hypothetical protein